MSTKLTSDNYLIWRDNIQPLFASLQLLKHIDGSSSSPSKTITVEDKAVSNPDYAKWADSEQQAILLLKSSLSEQAAAEVIGITNARQIWVALEAAYSNSSVERIHVLRDSLRQLTKGTSSVSDFSHKFKNLCDQLAAIGHPVAEIDKTHWFLCGLGPSYETFSTSIRANTPTLPFRELVNKTESQELFLKSLHGSPAPVAFHAQQNRSSSFQQGRGRGSGSRGSGSRGVYASGRGRGSARRPPHCQLCRTNGHYASSCPNLHAYANQTAPTDESLAKAFHAQCHVTENGPDWNADSGATDHMAPECADLNQTTPYPGSANKTGTR
ncbi:putative RNA-directed DNA polymerase [Helianthus annuus]|uniref:Putative zinc finger, CCHC-type n=1 Tax=Helianthus annuus TaxID=4232 RepID=A0A251SMF8_HELAN|nr:putative RNA-directed DNA polymerase [Helianthus annuus]KAJ0841931.1 putative RNA-directed DNA polymerase [Helianthus annuus]